MQQPVNETGADRTRTIMGVCGHCSALLGVPRSKMSASCPYCGQDAFVEMDAAEDNPLTAYAPELVLPYSADAARVRTALHDFVKTSWFSPVDMTAGNLNKRLLPLYLPMWLVDADVQAQWQAEVGFDYEVVSHREQFRAGSWHTQRVKETKVRWEPRLGTLTRHYANRPAPGLEEQKTLESVLGRFELGEALPYRSADTAGAVQRYPNRMPDDAWSEAEAAIKRSATRECQKATEADHIREFRWSAGFNNRHWTQLLLPVYTTYYHDDEGNTQMVYVHGQTARVVGQRRASMAQARKWSLGIGAVALIFLLLTIVLGLVGYLLNPDLLSLAGLALVGTIFMTGGALLPLLLAYYFNHFTYFSAASALRRALRQPDAAREDAAREDAAREDAA